MGLATCLVEQEKNKNKNYLGTLLGASRKALVVKNPAANAGDVRRAGSLPESGRSLGGEHVNPLRYSCLENPMDRGGWRVMVHRVTRNHTLLKQLSTHTPVFQ